MRHLIAATLALAFSSAALGVTPVTVKPVSLPIVGMNGESTGTWNMADQKNAVFVFEAFANFCGYCHQNAPLVDEMAIWWKSQRRVQIIDIGMDRNPREYAQWMARHKPNHTVLNDGNKALFRQMTTSNSIPQTFVVDCKGNLVEHTIGAWGQSTVTQINAAVGEALQTTCE